MEVELECPRCQGSGECAECKGTGSTECPNCQGAGKRTTSRGTTYDCKACEGQGTLVCSKDCSSCAGSGAITEELQKETREKYHLKFANFTPGNAVTIPLLVINVAIYVALQIKPELLWMVCLTRDSFSHGHYWSVLTPSFVQYSTWHVVVNMMFLWYYCPIAEGLLGKRRFLALYLGSGLTATALSWLGQVQIEGGYSAGVGSSGPLFGVIGAFIALYLRWKIVPRVLVEKLARAAGFILVVGVGLSLSGFGIIDNWAHIGGFLGGFLLMYVLPRPQGR